MTKKRKTALIIILGIVIVLLAASIFILIANITKDSKYTYIEGVVTAYDETPSYSDGLIVFSIDTVDVDIGGGLRPSSIYGYVDSPLKVGDKVQAKLVRSENWAPLTIYDCSECYVKKIK